MTKVVFYKHNGVFYGFHEVGHAGYGEFGTDIIFEPANTELLIAILAEGAWEVLE